MLTDDNAVTQYRVYPIRWIQLLVYFSATFASSLHPMTFSAIASETSTFFGITITQVNTLVIVFAFIYAPGTILSIWLSKFVPLRTVMIVGGLLNLGGIIRLFALISPSSGYPALIIGQIFPAFATPLFMNISALFAARWFAPKQRDIATAIGSMANPLGSAIGTLLPALIVTDSSSSKSFFILLLIQTCFSAFITFLIITFIQSEPPTPPSPSEEKHLTINIKKDLISLLTNRHYIILLIGFSLGYGMFNAMTSVLYQLIAPSGYTSKNAGIFGALIIISGLINACLAGVIMDRTHAYRVILKILLLGAIASGIFFIIILQPNKLYPLAISVSLIGFFLLPLLPVTFECAVECTYPIRAEWPTGLLLCSGSVLAGFLTFSLEALIKLAPLSSSVVIITPASIFILCCYMFSTLVLFFYNGPYRRLAAERQAIIISSIDT